MATEAQAKALGFIVPADTDRVMDGAAAIRANDLTTVDLASNRVVIGNNSYQGAGVFPVLPSYEFTAAVPLYYATVTLARPYAAPAGWGFVPYIYRTARYGFVVVADAAAASLLIRYVQVATNSVDANLRFGWRLTPIA